MAGSTDPQQKRQNSAEEYDEKYSAPSLDTFNTLAPNPETHSGEPMAMSPSGQRADASRLTDDLEVLRAERLISNQEQDEKASRHKGRKHNAEPEDAFNQPLTNVSSNTNKKDPDAALYKFWIFLKKFPRMIRYLVYLIPGAALLLIPVLLGAFQFDKGSHPIGGDGGVYLMWFGIWLEIIWSSLWISRMITSLMPHSFQLISRLGGSTNPKKWRDVGQQLELHTALFLWFLAILISFKPTNAGHRASGEAPHWIDIVNKVIIALFVLAALNFAEKICIQWIATSFHQRTYATRIENNKADIRQLVHLFDFAKVRLEHSDTFWQDAANGGMPSGAQTPMQTFHQNARQVWGRVGLVANKVGNDFIGRKVDNNIPRKVVSELLRTTSSAHTLARLIYRSVVREDRETVYLEDLLNAFASEEEAEVAFGVFDKDMNGDISMEEFEAVCNEIHLEKKAIAASLKDLDSVIQKLDKVFLFVIVVIAIIVFISILSGSAAAGLASAGTSVLGLAWMLQATAQEFLQSIIFVFIKHPFDVGDRVTIYGSTGDNLSGDDYYVTEISLLYTEFKKMQGHIVQAPNSLLNTLFILNQRRSNGLADVVPLVMRFGTPSYMIEDLKARMLDFCLANKRDYQPNIISEMSSLDQVRSCTMNIVFFHKSNFQNELLRLNRHNKFMTELMAQMVDIGIQAPFRIEPGGSREFPMYWADMPPPAGYGKEQQYPHHHDDNASHAAPSVKLTRSSTQQSDRVVPNTEGNAGGFQDVFENRREQKTANRMASIREKEHGMRREMQAEGESESQPRASTTSAALAPTTSRESNSRRVWGRMRSKSKSQQEEIV